MSRWLAWRLRRPPLSLLIDRRVPPVLLGLGLVALAVMVINMGVGEYPIPPIDVLKTVFGRGNAEYDFIVNGLRLPRNLVAFLVGAALALSGAILQGLTRNPLVSPDVIGITGGGNLAAVSVILLARDTPQHLLPLAAFGGALAATALTYLLAWKKGSSPIRLILVGIGITATAQALVTFLITNGVIFYVAEAMIWLTGSAYGRSWEHLNPLLAWLAVSVPLALLLGRHLNALHLGDDVARGLGSRVELQRALLLLVSVALAGAAIATAGAVGFVGLMAPHIARRLVGPAHGGLLPTAAMVGGLVVTLADALGRTILAPIEIPAGVLTAAVGAPYFIYLLYRSRNL